MFKTIALALVLAGVSVSFIANAAPAPSKGPGYAPGFGTETYMLDRHDPTNTNSN